jgi:hypothetical protein
VHTLWGSRPNYNPQCVQSSAPGFDHSADAEDAWAAEPKTTAGSDNDALDSDREEDPSQADLQPDTSAPRANHPSSTPGPARKRAASTQEARDKGRSTKAKLNAESIQTEVDQLTNSFAAAQESNTAATIRKAELRNEYRKHKLQMKEERRKNRFNAAMEVYHLLYLQWDSDGRTGPHPTPPVYE